MPGTVMSLANSFCTLSFLVIMFSIALISPSRWRIRPTLDHGLHLLVRKEPLNLGILQFLDILALHPESEVPGEDVLDAQDVGGPVADELEPLAEEVSRRPLFFGIDIAGGKDPQSQEVRKPEGAPLIIDLLEPFILFDGGDLGQMNTVTLVHEAVHKPVPVKR